MAKKVVVDGTQELLSHAYRPPSEAAQQPYAGLYDEDRDLAAVTPTGLCRAASLVAIGTALYTLLLAVQAVLMVRSTVLGILISVALFVPGCILLMAGWKIRRLYGRATRVGLWTSLAIALLGAVWFLTNLLYGVANLMPLIVVLAASLSSTCCTAILKRANEADRARARLAEHGVELGS